MNRDSAAPGWVEPPGYPSVAVSANALVSLLGDDELEFFSTVGCRHKVAAGRVLFQRGDVGTRMYVLIEGRVDLDLGEELAVKQLGPGEFFGELGLLIGDHERSASALVVDDSTLIEVDHRDFERLMESNPVLVADFLRRSIRRVVDSERSLITQLRCRNRDMETVLNNLVATADQLNQTEELIRLDELTGLHNRRGLALHLQSCRRNGGSPGCGLLLIDCDRFKRVNDEYGHPAGDRVLQNVARVLRSVIGEDDLACRLGGDEFCVVVGSGGDERIYQLGERIAAGVRVLLDLATVPPSICPVSIGMCRLDPTTSWSDWYTHADSALYQAKRLGGNRLYLPGAASFSTA